MRPSLVVAAGQMDDVIVFGGEINGSAVAREATLHGLSVPLVEGSANV